MTVTGEQDLDQEVRRCRCGCGEPAAQNSTYGEGAWHRQRWSRRSRLNQQARIVAVDALGAEVSLEPVLELVAVADRLGVLVREVVERLESLDPAAVAATLEARNAALAIERARRAEAEQRAEQAETAAAEAWESVRQGLARAVDVRARSALDNQAVLEEFRMATSAAEARAKSAEERADAAEAAGASLAAALRAARAELAAAQALTAEANARSLKLAEQHERSAERLALVEAEAALNQQGREMAEKRASLLGENLRSLERCALEAEQRAQIAVGRLQERSGGTGGGGAIHPGDGPASPDDGRR